MGREKISKELDKIQIFQLQGHEIIECFNKCLEKNRDFKMKVSGEELSTLKLRIQQLTENTLISGKILAANYQRLEQIALLYVHTSMKKISDPFVRDVQGAFMYVKKVKIKKNKKIMQEWQNKKLAFI